MMPGDRVFAFLSQVRRDSLIPKDELQVNYLLQRFDLLSGHYPDRLTISRNFDFDLLPQGPPCISDCEATTLENDAYAFRLETAFHDERELALLTGSLAKLTRYAAIARKAGLSCALGPYRYKRIYKDSCAPFSNIMVPQSRMSPDGSCDVASLIVGYDEDKIDLAWLAVAFGWNELLGNVLGYPTCCIDFFAMHWPEAAADRFGDLTKFVLTQTQGTIFERHLNYFTRYFGGRTIDHFPCSLNCSRSQAHGQKILEVLNRMPSNLCERSLKLQGSAVIVTKSDDIVLIPNYEYSANCDEWVLAYSPDGIETTTSSSLWDFVIKNSWLTGPLVESSSYLGDSESQVRLLVFS